MRGGGTCGGDGEGVGIDEVEDNGDIGDIGLKGWETREVGGEELSVVVGFLVERAGEAGGVAVVVESWLFVLIGIGARGGILWV